MGGSTGLGILQGMSHNRQAKAHNKRIDNMISDNKGLQKRLGIDARVAQDWASSQLVKHRNNREALGAVEGMYANKISGTTQGIMGLRQQSAQLATQKVKKRAWWEGAAEGGLQGAGMVASLYAGGVLGGEKEDTTDTKATKAAKVGGGLLANTTFGYYTNKLLERKREPYDAMTALGSITYPKNNNLNNEGNIGFNSANNLNTNPVSIYSKYRDKPYDPMTALGYKPYNPMRALGVSNVR